jgi:acyl-CoA synthetase (NDP forming)
MSNPYSTDPRGNPAFHVRDLQPLLAPRAIAVVGASDRPGAGANVLENLLRLGYPGHVYPVNPKYTELAGWRCYPSLGELPEPIDSVAILLGSRQVLPVLEQAVLKGARAAWVLASGFGEAGPEGEIAQRELTCFAAARGLALCGPNCIGVVNLHARMATYSVALPDTIRSGHVGAVVQSGAVCLGIANANRGFGFSTLISSGNEAVLDNSDYIAYLIDDPQTHVVIAFIEGFKNPDKFVWAAERARQQGKPLLVVKVGRSDVARRATLAHTGSLAGSDAVYDALFRKHAVIRLDSLDELLEAAELFVKSPLPEGRGVALLTLSGGQIGLIGDLMQGLDLHLPAFSEEARSALAQVLPAYSTIANPLDAWGAGDFEHTYPACMHIVAQEPDVHLLAVSRDSSPGIAAPEVRQSLVILEAASAVAAASRKPVVVFANIANGIDPAVKERADALGLALLQGARASLRAIEALVRYAGWARRAPADDPRSPVSDFEIMALRRELVGKPDGLTEQAGKRLLAAYGVPVAREALATSPSEAARLARQFGASVALKIQSPDILHKTEVQGVLLNLQGPSAVRRGYAEILQNVRRYNPAAHIDGVLVQEMVPPGAVEVIVGSSLDPEFGPVIVFGLGGVLVELFQDSSLRLAPVSRAEALEMIMETRGAALLRGYRGRPAADVEALADAICRVSHLAADLRNEIAAVDVNPLMVLPAGEGVVAADALVLTAGHESRTPVHRQDH